MKNSTGFNAYIFYCMVRAYYKNKKYDIIKNKINKNRFVNKWNEVRAKKDGHFFKKVEDFLPRDRTKFIKYFSYYYNKDINIYIKEIVDDEFRLYDFNEFQLMHVKEGVKSDFRCVLNFTNKNKITLKDIIRGNGLPPIFKLYDINKISVYSLIVFNEIFGLIKNVKIDDLDIIDRERYTHYKQQIFNKFRFVVYDELFKADYNWVEILKGV